MIDLKQLERSYKTGAEQTFALRHTNTTIREGDSVTVMGPRC